MSSRKRTRSDFDDSTREPWVARILSNFSNPYRLFNNFHRLIAKRLKLPMMAPGEREIIVAILKSLKNPSCLEWGSGYSTLYFPKFISSGNWIAIEHSMDWFEQIRYSIDTDNTEVLYIPLEETDRNGDQNYVKKPLELGRRFDFILIDGKLRVECAETAAQILNEGGCVFIHDTCRTKYHRAFQYFSKITRYKTPGYNCADLTLLMNPRI